MTAVDPYGMPHPDYNEREPRFVILVDEHNPDEEPGWRYKLRLIDRKYQDSEGFPIEAVPAGDSWEEAFATAGQFVTRALAAPECIF